MCSRVTTTGGRSPGSLPFTAFPDTSVQWLVAKGSPLTVAGAAAESGLYSNGIVFEEASLTAFPFDPQGEPSS
jgi:hypothetical protein